MKIKLERHMYAPELNKAFIRSKHGDYVMMPAPGCKTISDVRKKYFQPLKYTGRFVTLKAENTPDKSTYNRTRSGFCNDLRSLAGALKSFRTYHNLPGCKHIIKTQLIG